MAFEDNPLADLQSDAPQETSLADVTPDRAEVAPVSNKASNTNLAAFSTMFSENPDDVLTNYDAVNGQMEESGKSVVADRLISSAQQVQRDKVRSVLPTLLADKTVSDSDKLKALNNAFDDNSSIYHPANILASEALIQEVPGESVEAEEVRFDSSMVINRANQIKRAQQNLLNAEMAKNNPSVTNKVMDIVQLMFPGANQYITAKARAEATGDIMWSYIKSFVNPAGARQDLREMIKNAPPDKQVEMTQKLLDVINDTSGIVMSNPNDFARVQAMQQVVGDNEVQDADKWVENFAALSDLAFGLGSAAKVAKGVKAASAATKAAKADASAADAFTKGFTPEGPTGPGRGPGAASDTVTDTEFTGRELAVPNIVVSKVQPASVSQVLKDTNPDKFRGLHSAMADDASGKVAEAAYGTTREDAIFTDLGPQVAKSNGAVTGRVNVPDANILKSLDVDPDLSNFIKQDGAIYYTNNQKAANNSRIVNDFQSAFGVTSRKEMFQALHNVDAKPNGNTLTIKAVYGPQESGFSDPQSAIDAVKFALRDYGVTDDSIQLLKRDGGDYVPVDKNTVTGGIDPGFTNVQNDSGIKAAYDAGRFAETIVKGGSKIRLVGVEHPGFTREVIAFDQDGKQIGNVLYGQGSDHIDNPNLKVTPDWQHKGVANAMYDYAEKHGAQFPDVSTQRNMRSEAGQAFRDARAKGNRPKLQFSGNGGGDYLVQVNHNYKYNPFSMTDYPINKVNNNFFMRSGILQGSSGAGSLQRHLINITSMLEPHITLSMSKAVTKTAGVMREFLRLATDASRDFTKLKDAEKSVVMEMIREGNYKGKWWSETEMQAAGLSDLAKGSLRKFRKYWDNHFFFENMDHTKSLSNAGYMKFEDAKTDTSLWARPIKTVTNVPSNVRVYDPVADQLRSLRDDELVDIYNNGGLVAELEGPEVFNGTSFQHILSRENTSDGYLRAFNESDQTLTYRPGYYHVAYKDPIFIVKRVVDPSGRVTGSRAVATAGNTKDAEIMADRLRRADGGDYFIRGDQKNQAGRDSDNRSVQRARGRSPQRFRGKRLEAGSANVNDPSQSNIQSPSEAMINSARSISRRVAMRDPIDAMKQGLMAQYDKFMPSVNGRKVFPSSIMDIKNPSGETRLNKDLAAARSTYEYIQQMEHGYINIIDDAYKAIFNKIGDVLGEVSVDTKGVTSKAAQKAEGGIRSIQDIKPSKVLRSGANTFFIVTNAIRQLLVQGHQIFQLVPMNPAFFSHPQNQAKIMFLISKQLGTPTIDPMLKAIGMNAEEAEDLWTQFKLSGNFAAIDAHTMINESLKDFVDGVTPAQKIGGKVLQVAAKPVSVARKIGFDAGENLNQTVAWLVFRDLAIRSGKDMSDMAVRDEVAAMATNFTGNMNKAGQNPYEANALSIGLQFMGWAHRWGGIMTGNRLFTKGQKGKLWAWQLLMYGMIGGYGGYGLFEPILPKDSDTKDAIVQGLVGASYNKIASTISGQDVHADWSGSLSPYDMYGTASHLKEVMTGDIGALFTDSPAGTLFFGGNPKITNLIKDAAKWTNLSEDSKDHPTKLSTVAMDFLNLFGGLSNAFKAAYAIETGKKLSSYTGKVVDTNITNTQALLLAAGIPSVDEAKSRYINSVMSDSYKSLQKDVEYFHEERKRVLLNNDITPDQFRYYLDMTNEFFRAYPHNTQAQDIYKKLVNRDIQNGDTRILKQIMSMNGILPKDKALELAKLYPDTEEAKRKQYIDTIEFLYKDDNNGEEK